MFREHFLLSEVLLGWVALWTIYGATHLRRDWQQGCRGQSSNGPEAELDDFNPELVTAHCTWPCSCIPADFRWSHFLQEVMVTMTAIGYTRCQGGREECSIPLNIFWGYISLPLCSSDLPWILIHLFTHAFVFCLMLAKHVGEIQKA